MLTFKLALKNLIGAGTRTWLNVIVTSMTFVILISMNGLYDGLKEDSFRIILESEVAGGQYWHPEYDPTDPFTIEESRGVPPAGILASIREGDAISILIRQATFYFESRSMIGMMKGVSVGQDVINMDTAPLAAYRGDYIPAVIGSGMARKTGLKKGDTFTARWLDMHGTYDADEIEIAAVLPMENFRLDYGQIWLPIDVMRAKLDAPGEATYIIARKDMPLLSDTDGWMIRDADYFLKDIDALVDMKKAYSYGFFALILAIAALGIFNSQVLSIFRRRKEIGMLMALGMTRFQVINLFTVEGGLHGILALLVGALYGVPLLYQMATKGIAVPYAEDAGMVMSGYLYPVFGAGLITGTIIIVAITVTIVSFLPARRITKLQPTDALRGRWTE